MTSLSTSKAEILRPCWVGTSWGGTKIGPRRKRRRPIRTGVSPRRRLLICPGRFPLLFLVSFGFVGTSGSFFRFSVLLASDSSSTNSSSRYSLIVAQPNWYLSASFITLSLIQKINTLLQGFFGSGRISRSYSATSLCVGFQNFGVELELLFVALLFKLDRNVLRFDLWS